MRLASLIPFVVVAAQVNPALFEVELWPGEGRPRLRAKAPLELRLTPELTAPLVATVAVPADRDLAFDQTRYRTTEPGRLSVFTTTSVSGRVLGSIARLSRDTYYQGQFPTRSVEVTPASQVEYLQSRAEGTCFVRIDGSVIDADPCPIRDKPNFTIVTEPKVEWWVRILSDGKPAGWSLVDQERIVVVGRRF